MQQKGWIVSPSPTIKKGLDEALQIHCMFTTGYCWVRSTEWRDFPSSMIWCRRKTNHIVPLSNFHNQTLDLMMIHIQAKIWTVFNCIYLSLVLCKCNVCIINKMLRTWEQYNREWHRSERADLMTFIDFRTIQCGSKRTRGEHHFWKCKWSILL